MCLLNSSVGAEVRCEIRRGGQRPRGVAKAFDKAHIQAGVRTLVCGCTHHKSLNLIIIIIIISPFVSTAASPMLFQPFLSCNALVHSLPPNSFHPSIELTVFLYI